MDALVPAVEVADHADPPRIGRPDGEGDAVRLADLAGMRAQPVIQVLMCPFAHQVQVVLGEQRGEGVRVGDTLRHARLPLHIQPVRGGRLARDDQAKQPGGMQHAHGQRLRILRILRIGRLGDDPDGLRAGQERAHDPDAPPIELGAAGAKHVERRAMPTRDERRDGAGVQRIAQRRACG